MEVIVWVEIFK